MGDRHFLITASDWDYAQVALSGANHVRFGMSYVWWKNYTTDFFNMLDVQISFARNNNLWVVLTLFTAPDSSMRDCYEGYSARCGIWGSAAQQQNLLVCIIVSPARNTQSRYPIVRSHEIEAPHKTQSKSGNARVL